MNQAIDFVDNSLPTAFDIYKVKCEALMLLDLRAKKLAQTLLEMQNAIEQLELEINQGTQMAKKKPGKKKPVKK